MTTTLAQKPSSIWYPPAGQWSALLHEIKIDADQVRLIFKIPQQAHLTQDHMAGKTFKREQHKFLVNDLEAWLGRERLRDLCVGTTLTFENLKKVIGEAAMIQIELKECGQLEKFRNIRSIRRCKNEGSAPTAGIDLKSLDWKWN